MLGRWSAPIISTVTQPEAVLWSPNPDLSLIYLRREVDSIPIALAQGVSKFFAALASFSKVFDMKRLRVESQTGR
jgi:hypothetical protein